MDKCVSPDKREEMTSLYSDLSKVKEDIDVSSIPVKGKKHKMNVKEFFSFLLNEVDEHLCTPCPDIPCYDVDLSQFNIRTTCQEECDPPLQKLSEVLQYIIDKTCEVFECGGELEFVINSPNEYIIEFDENFQTINDPDLSNYTVEIQLYTDGNLHESAEGDYGTATDSPSWIYTDTNPTTSMRTYFSGIVGNNETLGFNYLLWAQNNGFVGNDAVEVEIKFILKDPNGLFCTYTVELPGGTTPAEFKTYSFYSDLASFENNVLFYRWADAPLFDGEVVKFDINQGEAEVLFTNEEPDYTAVVLELSGVDGTCDILVNSTPYSLSFDTSLTITAQNFVGTHQDDISDGQNVSVNASAGKLVFIGESTPIISVLSVTGTLGGTVNFPQPANIQFFITSILPTPDLDRIFITTSSNNSTLDLIDGIGSPISMPTRLKFFNKVKEVEWDGSQYVQTNLLKNLFSTVVVPVKITRDSFRTHNGESVYWIGRGDIGTTSTNLLLMMYYDGANWQTVDFSSKVFPGGGGRGYPGGGRIIPYFTYNGGDLYIGYSHNGNSNTAASFNLLEQTTGSKTNFSDFSDPNNWDDMVILLGTDSTSSGNQVVDGFGTSARFTSAGQIVVDFDTPTRPEIMYMEERGSGCIRIIEWDSGAGEYEMFVLAGGGTTDGTPIKGFADTSGILGQNFTARFENPEGLVRVDSNLFEIFTHDVDNNRIRKINILSADVTTAAGTGNNNYQLPLNY